MKAKTVFICTECNAEQVRWLGQCPSCGAWNSLEEKAVYKQEVKASKQLLLDGAVPVQALSKFDLAQQKRISSGFVELDLVLSGGFVAEQVVLFSGEPGVGKSTLLLQVLANLAKQSIKVLYVSGEESGPQVASRARRLLGDSKLLEGISFLGGGSLQSLLATCGQDKPDFIVIDSIQTIFDEDLSSLPGSLAQVKACTSALVRVAKQQGITLLLVGHINKDGAIAGPKVLEHLVDTVLQFEGERESEVRIVRVLKNRFGFTGEVGVLAMTEAGLIDMAADNQLFGGESESTVGAARTLVFEGNRPLLVQVQALVSKTVFAYPKRVAEGIPLNRLQLLCAIVERFLKVDLASHDVYVRTAGGFNLKGHSADMAIVAAILSSLKSKPISGQDMFVGELSMGGRFNLYGKYATAAGMVSKFGLKRLFTPAAGKALKGWQQAADVTELSKLLS